MEDVFLLLVLLWAFWRTIGFVGEWWWFCSVFVFGSLVEATGILAVATFARSGHLDFQL